MKIVNTEIIPVVMTKEDPQWRFALGGGSEDKGMVVKLIADKGVVGVGYNSAPAHHGVSHGGLQAALEAYTPHLIGQDPFNTEKIFGILNSVLRGNNVAKAAIDLALHDLQAKALDLPLYALMGGLFREEIPILRILGLKEPAQMAANAIKLAEKGYSYIKIKLGGEPAKDLERVKKVRKAVGDAIHLTVDANQSYSAKMAIDTLKRMHEYRIELCEQPVRADDWQGLATVTRSVDCLVEAHESALELEKIFCLVKDKVVDSINLKIGQVGGLRNAKMGAAICKLGNVSCRVGATGSRILAAACMHFVASTENISYACELGEFSRLLNDPADGLEVEDGKLRVPTGPGIGVSLRT